MKLYAVEYTTHAIVVAESTDEAERVAKEFEHDAIRDVCGMDITVVDQITREIDLAMFGWDGSCLPYGTTDDKRIHEYFDT